RLARADEARAGRAAARAVQGRGSPARPRARPAQTHGVAPAAPGRRPPEGRRAADALIEGEARAAGLYESIWQSFGVLLPVRSVGVMGDARTYEEALALRAVHSRDGRTAGWVRRREGAP